MNGKSDPNKRKIFCCGCTRKVEARLTDGKEIYPHRQSLHRLPFWKCDDCHNYVGCHHKTKRFRTTPLGVIPTKALRQERRKIHDLLDPIWRSGVMSREEVYKKVSRELGHRFHAANLRTIEEAREAYRVIKEIRFGRAA